MAGLIKPPFGVPAAQLPSPAAAWGTQEFNTTEGPLNRTEPIYKGIIWPMLYLHGGPTCHVLLKSPTITGCQLKSVTNDVDKSTHMTAVSVGRCSRHKLSRRARLFVCSMGSRWLDQQRSPTAA